MRFKKGKTWGNIQTAIVDSGAYISLLPKHIWQECDYNVIGKDKLRGVVPKTECELSVDIAIVTTALEDEFGKTSEPIEFTTYLVDTNKVPLIIGYKELLERFSMYVNINENNAYLECG